MRTAGYRDIVLSVMVKVRDQNLTSHAQNGIERRSCERPISLSKKNTYPAVAGCRRHGDNNVGNSISIQVSCR